MDKYSKALLHGLYGGLASQVLYLVIMFVVFLIHEPNDKIYLVFYFLVLLFVTWYYFKVLKTDSHNPLSVLMFMIVCGVVSYVLFMNVSFGLFFILLSIF